MIDVLDTKASPPMTNAFSSTDGLVYRFPSFASGSGAAYLLSYDAENRLVEVWQGSELLAGYLYDGDGRLVKRHEADGTTIYAGPQLEVFEPDPRPQPAEPPDPQTLSFSGTVTGEGAAGAHGVPFVELKLRRRAVHLAGSLSASTYYAPGSQLAGGRLKIFDYNGNFVTEISYGACKVWRQDEVELPKDPVLFTTLMAGSYQAYLEGCQEWSSPITYSAVSAFAIHASGSDQLNFNASQPPPPPLISPMTPLPYQEFGNVVNTTITTTTTSDGGAYLLNYPSPTCPQWYACSLHIDLTDPLGYPVTGASTGSGEGGTVVSETEIRYEWVTEDEHPGNHFTLQKHFRSGAGLVWMVYYGGNVLRVEGGLSGNGLYYLLKDHLGSTMYTVKQNLDGSMPAAHTGRVLYRAWGEVRHSSGGTPTDQRYTGQRDFGLGLYFYNARFYDPSLGRFISADTIIPNPGNVLDWDRYSYVRNNPLKYIDPTGHFCDMVGSNQICSADPDSNGHWLPSPDFVYDPVGLTSAGSELLALFELYQTTSGWWNNYGALPFNLNAFLGMWILFESAYNLDVADLIISAISQNLFVGGWNSGSCQPGGVCSNAVLNFMASFIDGSSALRGGPANAINVPKFHDKVRGLSRGAYNLIRSFGGRALNPRSVVSWDRKNGPSIWGNINGTDTFRNKPYNIPESSNKQTIINGIAANTVYYYKGNFVILSVNQYNYWKALGVDMSLTRESY
jgi:RHS repeat-associated protein